MSARSGPQAITVEAPTVTIAGLDYGNPAARPLVFLHGLTDLAWSLHPVAEAFAPHYHVVSLDLRGHGDSTHPGRYTVAHFVADLRFVIDALALDHPILFGHSMGAFVTSAFAGLWPDDPAALIMVEGLGSPLRIGETDPAGRRTLARALIESLNGSPKRVSMADINVARQRLRAAHPGLTDDRIADLADQGTRVGPDGGLVWKWDPAVREWFAVFDRTRHEEWWGGIRCPTLAISAAHAWDRWWRPTSSVRPGPDFAGPVNEAEQKRRLALIAGVEHHVVDAGHMVHFDAPDEVITLTRRFLDTHRLG